MLGIFISLSSLVGLVMSVVGVLVSWVSLNMAGIWVGMELSFLSTVCFASGSSVGEAEGVMKYYIVQVLSSCILALGVLMTVNFYEVILSYFLILMGLLMKLGVFPFHFWVGPVVSSLSWGGCGSLLLIQKLIPLWVLSNFLVFNADLGRIEFLCCMTSLVGCLGGLGVLNYRVLMGFSSVQNLGPLLLLCCCDNYMLWVYVGVYFLLSGSTMVMFWKLCVYSFQDLLKEKNFGGIENLWWISLFMLSSAGVPPFLGCAMKVALLSGGWELMPLGAGLCLLSSAVSLAFYLSVVLAVVIYWGKSMMFISKFNRKQKSIGAASLLINVGGSFLLFLFLSL